MAQLFDLHIHTNRHSPDSMLRPRDLVERAREAGLAGFVITEHDWLWTERELAELRATAPGLLIFSGIEVSAEEGHFLVYGVKDPFAVPRGIGVAALAREAHRQGGAIIAAHPWRWGQPFDDILREEQPDLDGTEVMTSNMDLACRSRAGALRDARGWSGLGSSDAHVPEVVACCTTIFSRPVRDEQDLIASLRSGAVRALDRVIAG